MWSMLIIGMLFAFNAMNPNEVQGGFFHRLILGFNIGFFDLWQAI
jgi:hypothetical protein